MKGSSKAVLWVLLVFVIGAAFGTTATFLLIRSRILAQGLGVGNPLIRPPDGRLFKRMLRRLDLDTEQERQIRQTLEQSRARYRVVGRETNGRLKEIRRETLSQIRSVLRPDQVLKLNNFLLRLNQRRRERKDVPDPVQ
ncbi:MAG: hypothetical protein ACE5JX_19360 [Acidobacteriota bacterium]